MCNFVRLSPADISRELDRLEALEDEAIDRFHKRIMAIRNDKAALKSALERSERRA